MVDDKDLLAEFGGLRSTVGRLAYLAPIVLEVIQRVCCDVGFHGRAQFLVLYFTNLDCILSHHGLGFEPLREFLYALSFSFDSRGGLSEKMGRPCIVKVVVSTVDLVERAR